MTQNLFENWDATKGALTDGLEGNKKVVMESVLENTKAYLAEAASGGATGAGNIARYQDPTGVITGNVRQVDNYISQAAPVEPGVSSAAANFDAPNNTVAIVVIRKYFILLISRQILMLH